MLEIDIPGCKRLCLSFLVSDYNGTLACDGKLITEVAPLIQALSSVLEMHIVTADTFGLAERNLRALPIKLSILAGENQDQMKAAYLNKLGAEHTVALGNGRNDTLMLRDAALGICLTEAEGTCVQTLQAADVACRTAVDGLNLLLNPKRLVATLRI